MNKTQFNVRLPRVLRTTACTVADALAYTRDEMAEIALAVMLGCHDEVMAAKWKAARKAAERLPGNESADPLALVA